MFNFYSALAIAEDNHPTKQSYRMVVPSRSWWCCSGSCSSWKEKMLALNLDVQVYGKGTQKWKTLYLPKLDDPHSSGMNIVQNDDISTHIVQCGDNFTELTEFTGMPVLIALVTCTFCSQS